MGSTQTSSSMAPVFLRLGLGLVFIWAGLGKVMTTMNVTGEDAAILANMGVVTPGGTPAGSTPEAPQGEAPKPAPGASRAAPGESRGTPRGTATAAPDPTGPALPELMQVVRVSERTYTAADFPDPVGVKPVYMLALSLKKAATPDGKGSMVLWPGALAHGSWPVWTAWAVTWAEIGGGALVLVGLLTRIGALALGGVMLGAIWLTQVGPALQSGNTRLGFLPNHDVFDGQAWQMLLVQFTLL